MSASPDSSCWGTWLKVYWTEGGSRDERECPDDIAPGGLLSHFRSHLIKGSPIRAHGLSCICGVLRPGLAQPYVPYQFTCCPSPILLAWRQVRSSSGAAGRYAR